MTQHPKPLSEPVGLPDTDQRKWTIYVSDGCISHLANHYKQEPIEVVPAEALSVEREGRTKLRETLERVDRMLEGMRINTGDSDMEYRIHEAIRAVAVALGQWPATSQRGESRDSGAGEPEAGSSSRSVALGVAADLRKWAESQDTADGTHPNLVAVHRAKLLSRAARLEGKEE